MLSELTFWEESFDRLVVYLRNLQMKEKKLRMKEKKPQVKEKKHGRNK